MLAKWWKLWQLVSYMSAAASQDNPHAVRPGLFLIGFVTGCLVAGLLSEMFGRNRHILALDHGRWVFAKYRIIARIPLLAWVFGVCTFDLR